MGGSLAISRVSEGPLLQMERPLWVQPETASQPPPNQEANGLIVNRSAFRI